MYAILFSIKVVYIILCFYDNDNIHYIVIVANSIRADEKSATTKVTIEPPEGNGNMQHYSYDGNETAATMGKYKVCAFATHCKI